jgi:hypothetical protein
MKPNGEYILGKLVELLADQMGVKVKYKIERREKDA